MQACYIERYGKADVVQVGDLPAPEPGPGELLFRIQAASVNPVDFKTRAGMLRALESYRMPAILGNDAAGVITALGPGMAGFCVGDRVAARLEMLARGELQVRIEREFPLTLAPEALRLSEAGRVCGKLVIRPDWVVTLKPADPDADTL